MLPSLYYDTFPVGAAPPQRTFIHQPTHAQHSITHLCPLTQARTTPPLRKSAPFSTEEAEQMNNENGAVLPYNQIVDPMSFERLYGGIGEKSIEYPRKVYRVFPESL